MTLAVAAVATADTSWTDEWTAFGTVGAVVAPVWSQRRSDKQVKAEHRRGDQLAVERAHSAGQVEEERRLTREREQLAEAYAVQVATAEHGHQVS